jgi:carnitine 3-dehydrogenase
LIKDGIATTEEIDNAIRYGFGLRWAQMGLFETYRIAGGRQGWPTSSHNLAPV